MYKFLFKRMLDIIVGLCALPLVITFVLIFAPIIYIEDKGSIFYLAQRIGKGGNTF